ncbi:jg17393 [Pararge aegeria aegeria]|uniref:Jg17393 protein n=4 Tax=Pararge aegeria TaxID=116150 RepID=A0A8S4S0X8_9NEOP|nr:jg17393 [Pararge aegeria aegeria]
MMMRKERLFHFWFNTFFVTACVGAEPVPAPDDSPNLETFKLTLDKWQLDDAHKDKQHKLYSPDFKVELIIQKQPESSTFSGHSARASSSLSSCASSGSEPDTEPDGNWDSGERIYRPCHRCPYLYNTDYDYPDSYTSKPDDFADLPEYTPNDDDKLYMNVNDNSNTNTQYDDFSLSKNINVPDNSNGDKLYTNASEHTIDTNPRYDNSKSKTPELDDYLRMKTQERLNESSKSDESSQSVNIDDELCSNKVLQHNDNEMCRTEIDKASGVHSKPLSDDIEASRDTNFPVNNESCTCKLERLDRKSSFASHLLDDDKKLYTNQFELPVNTGLDKPECDYNVYRSNGENTIKPCQNLSKPQYYSVNADSCINKSKHPIGNMHTCNTDSIKRDFFTDIQSDNTFTNKVDYQVNTIDQNDVKYSIDNELSDPEDTGSINKSLDYFKTNLCTDGDSVCTKPPEYLDGTNIYQAVTEYSIGIEKTPQYLNSTEKPPDYSVESKKIVKTEEFSKKDKKCKSVSKPRLSLGDVRASWREFSGKFGENRKKKHKDDRQ